MGVDKLVYFHLILFLFRCRWLQVREMLCRHYDLDDNTPEEWLDMKDGVCPVCLSSWNDAACGPKKQLSCGHFIGSLCYGRLLSRTETQHRCPVCRHPI